jgi:hypothetical protein
MPRALAIQAKVTVMQEGVVVVSIVSVISSPFAKNWVLPDGQTPFLAALAAVTDKLKSSATGESIQLYIYI